MSFDILETLLLGFLFFAFYVAGRHIGYSAAMKKASAELDPLIVEARKITNNLKRP